MNFREINFSPFFQRKRHEERMRKEKEKQLEEEIMRKRGKKFREIVKIS